MKNTLTVILSELKVRYTHQFANKLYRETPDRNNFFGLSYMLSVYGIESKGYYIEEKDLTDIQFPFVAQTNVGFVLVTDVNNSMVICHNEKGRKSVTVVLFKESWTGNYMVIEKRADSEELDYDEHKRKERVVRLKGCMLFMSCLFLFTSLLIIQIPTLTIAMLLYMVLCFLGGFVSWLLLEKQFHSGSLVVDKICSLISKSGCDVVAHSSGSKTLLGVSWAEVGCGYFLSTLLLLLLIPESYIMLGIINLFTLPYTIWSLWYQKKVIKKWCTLCILVQAILWGLFAIFSISVPSISLFRPEHLLFVPLYIVTILFIHIYTNGRETIIQQESVAASYDTALRRKEVLATLLEDQSLIKAGNNDTHILIGNPSASLCLTIISNPFCEPCTHTHRIIERLIKSRNNIQVRYVFVSKNKTTYAASRYLVGSYFIYGDAPLNEWFNMSIADRKKLIALIEVTGKDEDAEKELQHHTVFIKNNNIKWTPCILINGRIVPAIYSIEDLAYILFE